MSSLIPKKVIIKCPWCKHRFQVQIEATYKGAEAIPDPLPTYEGYNQPCPKCERGLFIHCIN